MTREQLVIAINKEKQGHGDKDEISRLITALKAQLKKDRKRQKENGGWAKHKNPVFCFMVK